MKLDDATHILEGITGTPSRYRIRFTKIGDLPTDDFFPEPDETRIKTEKQANQLARAFADITEATCANIRVEGYMPLTNRWEPIGPVLNEYKPLGEKT